MEEIEKLEEADENDEEWEELDDEELIGQFIHFNNELNN